MVKLDNNEIDILKEAIQLLEKADCHIQMTLPVGLNDTCYDLHNRIDNIIDDIREIISC